LGSNLGRATGIAVVERRPAEIRSPGAVFIFFHLVPRSFNQQLREFGTRLMKEEREDSSLGLFYKRKYNSLPVTLGISFLLLSVPN
jgi:hypothetical protein